MLSNIAPGVMVKTAKMNMADVPRKTGPYQDLRSRIIRLLEESGSPDKLSELADSREGEHSVRRRGRTEPKGAKILEQHPYSLELTV